MFRDGTDRQTDGYGDSMTNSAQWGRVGENFKEHIAEVYAKIHSEYIRIGIFLKETQQLNYRLRFEQHTLQLQVKKPTAD